MLLRAPRRARLVLLGAVVLPIIIYSSVYIFSYWDPTLHLQSSMFRLLISPALVGILFVAVSFGEAVNAVKNPLILHERRIVIVNDFGEPARFVSFKAAIASRTGAPIVDLGRGSAAGDLEAAARLILDIEPSWEAGTIFVAALGGEAGTGEAVALAYHEKIFVAPAEMARFLPGRAVRLPDTQAGDSSADLAEVTAAIANGEHLAYSHRPVSGTPAAAGIS
jgi:hypothetical protein